jgi:hypothetical protein
VRLPHGAARIRAFFDEPNVVSCAGLQPVMALAARCDLHGIIAQRLDAPTDNGSNASGKVTAIVAGMLTGADSIDDLDVPRHGGMPVLFGGVYAPSTLVWDEDQQRFISRAQIAETRYTAFEGTRHEVTARLIARRVPDLTISVVTPSVTAPGQVPPLAPGPAAGRLPRNAGT